jgi:signal peptidase I
MSDEMVEKKKKSPVKKAFDIISTVIVALLFGFAIFYQIVSLTTRDSNYGVTNFFGTQILVVQTDSMEPEYPINDGLFVKKVDKTEIKVGDDITFHYVVSSVNVIITHRVGEIKIDDNGIYTFICHGINTESSQCDGDCTYQTQTVQEDWVLGKVVGESAFIGGFYNFMMQPYGLLVLVLIPGGYLVIAAILDLVKASKAPKQMVTQNASGEEVKADASNLSDEDRERLKKELLNEMLDKKGGDKK